jgi:peptidoglycan hydrolase-like protein with peptidoglycan-binding domain
VTGVDDASVDGSQNTTLTIAVVDASSDNDYDPVANQTVTATTTDNDTPGFTMSESSGSTTVSESGNTDTFTVVLNTQPASDVVLSVTSGDTGEATVSPATLTFTNGNWSSAQTITVTGVDDASVDGSQNTTLTIAVVDASSDNDYDPVANQTVSVTVADDDVSASPSTGNSSGSSSTYNQTVNQNTIPSALSPASPLYTNTALIPQTLVNVPGTFGPGKTDSGVLFLQKYLNTNNFIVSPTGAGSPGNETNFFGPKTKIALTLFQKANGLPPTGIFDVFTKQKINQLGGNTSADVSDAVLSRFAVKDITKTLGAGTTDSGVLFLQKYLNTHGVPVSATGAGSPGKETAFFGAKTKAALILFQQKNLLPKTGIFDAVTKQKMSALGV